MAQTQLPMTTTGTTPPKVKTYPAASRSITGIVKGIETTVTTTSFTDKIIVTITQEGRLAQWIQVPLSSRDPQTLGETAPSVPGEDDEDDDLMPRAHLVARTLLGASNEEREMTGQLYATQIASSVLAQRPDETRTLLVGLGLKPVPASREQFFDLLELVIQTIR